MIIIAASLYAIQMRDSRPPLPLGDEMSGGRSAIDVSPEKKKAFEEVMAGFDWKRTTLPAEFFREHYDTFGPETMLAVLDDYQFCHSEAHNLGRVLYEREQDLATATNICQSQCSSGCIHGVLMGLFAERTKDSKFDDPELHATIDDLTPKFRDEIAGICDKREIIDNLSKGDCYHAIGHALIVLANYDISSGLGLCAIFRPFGGGAEYYCATGVYMERDIEYGDADAAVSQAYPCDAHEFPIACMRYKMRRIFKLQEQYVQAAEMCANLEGALRHGCFHGLGFGAGRLIYREPAKASAVCAQGDAHDQRMCLEGAFGFTNIYDPTVAAEVCESYTGDAAVCTAATSVRNFSMRKDFTPYLE